MLACANSSTEAVPAEILVKIFIPQDLVDRWVTADKVELSGEIMTFGGSGLAVRMIPGYYFDHVAGGSDEGHKLLGRAKMKAVIAAMGAEVYMNSVILGETAYEVEAGFLAKPLDPGCGRTVVVAALVQAGY
jgi:hypothetical protein